MLDQKQFAIALNQIAEEKGISKDKIIETIEVAIAAAYKKDYGKKGQIIRAKFDPETGIASFSQIKIVVDETMLKEEKEEDIQASSDLELEKTEKEEDLEDITEDGTIKKVRFNPERHIMLDEAKKIKKSIKSGDELTFKLEAQEDYGRIAAQTAKQVIIQRLREAERESSYEEYKSKEGEIVNALVQRVEGRNIFFDLGKSVGIMFPEDQIPREFYRIGARLRVYIVAVNKDMRGPNIIVSRSHPKFINKLFELEVPEIASGIVEIKAVAREAGSRTKVAVTSHEDGVDPIGSCVGQKGTRISTIINELGGEKIDIVEWSDDIEKYLANSLSPAKVISAKITNEAQKEVSILTPEDQLSLAIGRGGQNVRLAAKLTGWKIDVRSAAKPEEKVLAEENTENIAEEVKEVIEEIKNNKNNE